ncbi:MAG: hypothetical protein WEE89_13955 [Gemmatimonadota bacterium]
MRRQRAVAVLFLQGTALALLLPAGLMGTDGLPECEESNDGEKACSTIENHDPINHPEEPYGAFSYTCDDQGEEFDWGPPDPTFWSDDWNSAKEECDSWAGPSAP